VSIENARLLARQTHISAQRQRVIDVSQRLSEKPDYETLLQDAPGEIRLAYGLDRVSIGLVEGEEVVLASTSSRDPDRAALVGARAIVGRGILGQTVSKGATLITSPDKDKHGLQEADPALGELRQGISVPMVSRGKVIGVLVAETVKREGMDDEDIEATELIASQLAVSLENMRLFAEMQTSLRQLDALYRDRTRESWDLLLESSSIEDLMRVSEYGEPPEHGLQGDRDGVLQTPIRLRGNVIGDLALEPKRAGSLSEYDREILDAVAEEVGDQLEQLRLMDEIRRRANYLQTASDITTHATRLLDLDALLERATRLIQERFGYYLVSVFLLDQSGETVFLREASGRPGRRLIQEQIELEVSSNSIIGQVIGTGRHYLAEDVAEDEFYQPHPLLPETRSELAIPLKIGDRVIGALDIQHSHSSGLREEEVDVLHILAD
jgi:GAF domain-containing protein